MMAIEAASKKGLDDMYIDDGEDPEGTFVGWFHVEDANGTQWKINVEPREEDDDSTTSSDTDLDIECSLEPYEQKITGTVDLDDVPI